MCCHQVLTITSTRQTLLSMPHGIAHAGLAAPGHVSGRQPEALQGQGAPGRIGVQKVSKVVQVGSRGVHLQRGGVCCCIFEPMTVSMALIYGRGRD